jgi:hypothetical protein
MKPLPEDAWSAWSPYELAERIGDTTSTWYVAGGWALDLWHGYETRKHEDLEFSVLPQDVDRFRALLSDLDFFTAKNRILEYLTPSCFPPAEVTQLWGADTQKGCWRVDMMLERGTSGRWIYKRDPAIQMPRAEAIRTSKTGIPYLAPANVLLFKAKHRRQKDERDFRIALPRLPDSERADLRGWLSRVHPDHDWLRLL